MGKKKKEAHFVLSLTLEVISPIFISRQGQGYTGNVKATKLLSKKPPCSQQERKLQKGAPAFPDSVCGEGYVPLLQTLFH